MDHGTLSVATMVSAYVATVNQCSNQICQHWRDPTAPICIQLLLSRRFGPGYAAALNMRPTLDFHHAPLCFTILRCLHTSCRPVLDAGFVRSAHLVYCNCCIGPQRHDKHKGIAIPAVGMSSLGLYKKAPQLLIYVPYTVLLKTSPFASKIDVVS